MTTVLLERPPVAPAPIRAVEPPPPVGSGGGEDGPRCCFCGAPAPFGLRPQPWVLTAFSNFGGGWPVCGVHGVQVLKILWATTAGRFVRVIAPSAEQAGEFLQRARAAYAEEYRRTKTAADARSNGLDSGGTMDGKEPG